MDKTSYKGLTFHLGYRKVPIGSVFLEEWLVPQYASNPPANNDASPITEESSEWHPCRRWRIMITCIMGLKAAGQVQRQGIVCLGPAGRTYAKCLDPIQSALMQKRIVPVSIPVLKKNTIQLIIHSWVRSTEYDSHVIGCRIVNPECVNVSGFDRGLPIFIGQFPDHTIHLHGTYPMLDSEIFGLKLMEVLRRTLWSSRAVDELSKILRDRTIDSTSVCLSEAERSPRKW